MNECFRRCVQYLGVSKVFPRENTSDTARTRSTYFEIVYCGSAILVVFRGSLILYYTLLVEYCCTSSISGICTAGTAKYWQYFVRLVLRVLRVLGVVPKRFQYAQYAGSMKYIPDILSTSIHPRFYNFIRILLQTAITFHGWSHEWELKQISFGGGTRVLRVLAVLREYMLRALEISAGSTLLILRVLQPFRMFVLRVLLVVLGVLY